MDGRKWRPWSFCSIYGMHVTKWMGTQNLFLLLAPHMLELFRISLFIPNGICSNKVQSTLSGGISFFLTSGLILGNIRRMVLLAIWAIWTLSMDFDKKCSPKCSRESDQIKSFSVSMKCHNLGEKEKKKEKEILYQNVISLFFLIMLNL